MSSPLTPQEEVVVKIEDLLRYAKRHKIIVAGFAFSVENPMLVNFGNCNDAHDIHLYEKLVEICQERRAQGKAIQTYIGEIN